jgi:hypothetical protein
VEMTKPTTPAPVETPAANDVPQVPEINREQVEKETAGRAVEIMDLCADANVPDMARGFIQSNLSMDQVRAKVLEAVIKKQAQPVGRVELVADDRDKFRNAAVDGLLSRAGYAPEKPSTGHEDFASMGFFRLALECCRRAGVKTLGLSTEEVFHQAFRATPGGSTSDFDNILGNTGKKVLMKGYNNAAVTYPQWCVIGDLPNFLAHKRVNLSDAPDLETVLENGEVKQAQFSDSGETAQLETKGVLIGLGRKALINDDLGAFKRIFAALGARARTNVNAAVYAYLIANGNMADGGALFNTTAVTTTGGHANMASSGGAISDTTLASGTQAMFSQVGPKGSKLNYNAAFILTGAAYKTTAEIIVGSNALYKTQMSSGIHNPFTGIKPIADANITGNKWYLAAHPSVADTIEVAFLNGKDAPTVQEFAASPNYLGKWFRVYLDYDVLARDFRGLYYNAGA